MLEVFKNDYEMFHSSFQIENFILIKNGRTTFGIYKQCLRELISRENSLRNIYAQKMKQDIAFEELEEKLALAKKEGNNTFEVRRLQIDRAELAYGVKDILKVISETEREYRQFYNAGVFLKEKLGDLTKEKREKLEAELWVESCKYKACQDIMTTQRISVETLTMICSMPNKERKQLSDFFVLVQGSTGQVELNKFLDYYSKNFEFGESLDKNLDFNIKKLVENNGSRD